MKFWYGSRSQSADLYFWLMDPDCDPNLAIFVSDLQDIQNISFFKVSLLITFWRYIYIIFQREKVIKKESMFSLYFCLMIEGSGSVSLTSGFRSGRPKIMGPTQIRMSKPGFWASFIRSGIISHEVRIPILPSSSTNSKKNLDFYSFVTSLWLLS